jgi:hypothetical protein
MVPERSWSMAVTPTQNNIRQSKRRRQRRDTTAAISLANFPRDRHATVVVYDYRFPPASVDPFWCPSLAPPRDDCPKRLEKSPCGPPAEVQSGDEYRRYPNYQFYGEKAVAPWCDDSPETFVIGKMLWGLFEGTGAYSDVLWTWIAGATDEGRWSEANALGK